MKWYMLGQTNVLLPLFWGLQRRWDHNKALSGSWVLRPLGPTAPDYFHYQFSLIPSSWLKTFLLHSAVVWDQLTQKHQTPEERHCWPQSPASIRGICSEPPRQWEDPIQAFQMLPSRLLTHSFPRLPSLGIKQQLKAKEKPFFVTYPLLWPRRDRVDFPTVSTGAREMPQRLTHSSSMVTQLPQTLSDYFVSALSF